MLCAGFNLAQGRSGGTRYKRTHNREPLNMAFSAYHILKDLLWKCICFGYVAYTFTW